MTPSSVNVARGTQPFHAYARHSPCHWQFDWHFACDDPSFDGHFPGYPLLPGVFLLEMARHAAEHALQHEAARPQLIRSVKKLRFLNPVRPGDACRLQIHWTSPEHIHIAFTKPGAKVALGVLCASETTNIGELAADRPPPAAKQEDIWPHEVLPHRYPMLLIDRFATDESAADRAIACKNITINEPCYRAAGFGSDVGGLAYPLALIIESFAQASGLLLSRHGLLGEAPSLLLFGEFRDIRLYADALPGDRLEHDVRLVSSGRHVARLTGISRVNDRLVASYGDLMAFRIDPVALLPAKAAI